MSRLKKRLERQKRSLPQLPQQPLQPADYAQQYEEAQQYAQQYEQEPESLVQEYDKLQKKAEEYQSELRAIEATNPHSLYKDIVTNPSPKNKLLIRCFGRPVDLAKLENYVVHKISPRTITTLMRYNDVRSIEDTKGYSKRGAIKMRGGIIWIILGAFIILILGYFLMTTDMTGMMKGLFGGM